MKIFKGLLIAALSLIALSATAQEKVLSSRTVILPVDISRAKLRYTNAGYGQFYRVKILVPELAAETIMNHRNEGEGAPCLATFSTDDLNDILQGNAEVIQAEFKIELKKVLTPVLKENVCRVSLVETVTTTLRGYEFVHERDQVMPDRVLADCQ